MATKSRFDVTTGCFTAVYDDRLRPFLEAFGKLNIRRATSVEYDEASQEWVATHLDTNQVIARGKNRDEVIAREVEWLEANVIR